jgi:hypothetical protein
MPSFYKFKYSNYFPNYLAALSFLETDALLLLLATFSFISEGL